MRYREQQASEAAHKSERGPGRTIFIVGIMPRSGTNFLHRLLCLHSDCGAINMTPVREDYMLRHGPILRRYVQRLGWQWGHWGDVGSMMDVVYEQIGNGLMSFLHTLTDAEWVVTKTPSVENVDMAFKLFPKAKLLVVVRDGRSVVASGMAGFNWNFEVATRRWARAARAVSSLATDHNRPDREFYVVSYERLHTDTVGELGRIFKFVGLDVARYEFDRARSLPVFGSSFVKGKDEEMSWKPMAKPEDFDGLERWLSWSRSRHERFNWLAGCELEALGYTCKRARGSRLPWIAMNVILDALYVLRFTPKRLIRGLKEAAKALLRSMTDRDS